MNWPARVYNSPPERPPLLLTYESRRPQCRYRSTESALQQDPARQRSLADRHDAALLAAPNMDVSMGWKLAETTLVSDGVHVAMLD